LRDVWRFRSPGRTRTVDAHAFRLRRKLTDADAAGLLVNVWGVGYRLVPIVAAAQAPGPALRLAA
jgi:DNA-binding response OmpR family regulator